MTLYSPGSWKRPRSIFILIGDSLGQVVLGYPSTIPVTLDEMIHHGKAVRRGAPDSFLVLDMPFLSYQVSTGRRSPELRASTEGNGGSGREVGRWGGCDLQSRGSFGPRRDSRHGPHRPHSSVRSCPGGLQGPGPGRGFCGAPPAPGHCSGGGGLLRLVLELVPAELAAEISGSLSIPTVGIGAGAGCDGQILVLYDALGLNTGFHPKFLKTFGDLGQGVRDALGSYVEEVREGKYPGPEHGFDREP